MLSFTTFLSIDEAAAAGLAAKASKSGISIGTLRKVYNRGMAAWNSGHRPGTTPQQWGMARVNSYISKGSGTYGGADKDLHEQEEQISEAANFNTKDAAVSYAKEKVKTHRDNLDGIEIHMHSGGYDVNHTSNASGRNSLQKIGAKHVGTVYKEEVEIEEGDTSKLPRVAKDKDSGLPQKYVAGLSKSTAKARAAHFAAKDKLSDSNPAAYEPAPGDATAKTKESKYTKKYHAMFGEGMDEEIYEACWDTHKQVGMKKKGDKMVPDCRPKNEEVDLDEKTWSSSYKSSIDCSNPKGFSQKAHCASVKKEEVQAQFDLIESVIEELALIHNLDSDYIWEKFEQFTDEQLLEYAVDAKGYKSSSGGLTQKGRDHYNSQSGGNLKAPVTTAPSKLKAGSKAANRRKSFCARMSGMEGAMKKPNGEPTRKALALRKWNC